jgi:hypothetical protein
MHGVNAEFAKVMRGFCADFQNRCAECRKFPRGFRQALVVRPLFARASLSQSRYYSWQCLNWWYMLKTIAEVEKCHSAVHLLAART